ncbi:unnamed protein product [Vitrella brassicaformis CCMP3155]|uniref:Uncharacterized protein n=2 Tax=Vitrella brassicaformis TaxID=1169539 RepID=A0A0G4EJM1_VITBC|nr:unnamed protein product [Vitrella brassicaformis CCMP3155]|eukprot:CEL97593.1 unnamed protein product [Vitrella brassicaformis CCMP3155]
MDETTTKLQDEPDDDDAGESGATVDVHDLLAHLEEQKAIRHLARQHVQAQPQANVRRKRGVPGQSDDDTDGDEEDWAEISPLDLESLGLAELPVGDGESPISLQVQPKMAKKGDEKLMMDLPAEFSRIVDVSKRLRAVGKSVRMRVQAKPEECNALAQRLKFGGLGQLSANLTLTRTRRNRIRVEGSLTADVLRCCYVTEEPLSSTEQHTFETIIAVRGEEDDRVRRKGPKKRVIDPVAAAIEAEREDMPDSDEDDWDDEITDGRLDVGEIVTQYMALLVPPRVVSPDAPDLGGLTINLT